MFVFVSRGSHLTFHGARTNCPYLHFSICLRGSSSSSSSSSVRITRTCCVPPALFLWPQNVAKLQSHKQQTNQPHLPSRPPTPNSPTAAAHNLGRQLGARQGRPRVSAELRLFWRQPRAQHHLVSQRATCGPSEPAGRQNRTVAREWQHHEQPHLAGQHGGQQRQLSLLGGQQGHEWAGPFRARAQLTCRM